MRRLLRRLLFTLSLVAGADLVLFLVLDSGLVGDPDRLSAGLHASPESVAYARLRSGRWEAYEEGTMLLRLDRAAPTLQLAAGTDGLRLERPDGLLVAALAAAPDDTLGAATTAWNGTAIEGWTLEAFCPPEHRELEVAGLRLLLAEGPRRLLPGEALALGWARETPWTSRFRTSFVQLLRFDFGQDLDGRSIATRLRERGGRSLALSVPAFLLATIAALGLAQAAVVFRGRTDRLLQATAALVMAVTSLAWILFLRRLFTLDLGWFPLRPWSPPVLPLLALPILLWVWLASWPDFLLYRTLLRERCAQGWHLAARARGVGGWRLWWHHLLPNLAAPLASLLAVTLPFLVLGSLLLERVFDIPGLGDALVRAIESGDHAFLRASTFLFALGFLAASWLGDALAAWVDPRLRRHLPAGGPA